MNRTCPRYLPHSPSPLMDLTPTPTTRVFSRIRALIQSTLVLAGLYIVMEGFPKLIYRFIILPCYYVKVAALTITAWVTDRSFVIRLPNQPPRFIARPSSQDIQAFTLSTKDKIHILSRVHRQTCIFPRIRYWRAPETVLHLIKHSNHYHPPLRIPLDLTPYHLVGPRLTQGLGLIGHGFCVALIEEFGRIPGEDGVIVGHFYSWNEEMMVHGRIPIPFIAPAGVEEIARVKGGMVSFVWPEFGSGIVEGIQAEVWVSPCVEFASDTMEAVDDDSALHVGV